MYEIEAPAVMPDENTDRLVSLTETARSFQPPPSCPATAQKLIKTSSSPLATNRSIVGLAWTRHRRTDEAPPKSTRSWRDTSLARE
jgi:hypothetical protein